MKKLLGSILLTAGVFSATTVFAADGDVMITQSAFPDDNFRAVVAQFDENDDGFLSKEERFSVTSIDATYDHAGIIYDLTGIWEFPLLESLSCNGQPIKEVDLRYNGELTDLQIRDCNLETLDVSQNPKLGNLDCRGNFLVSLDLMNNPDLMILLCDGNTRDIYDGQSLDEVNGFDITRCSDMTGGYINRGHIYFLDDSTQITYYYQCQDNSYMFCILDKVLEDPALNGEFVRDGSN